MPLGVAGLLTAVVSFLILGLERFGFRPLEAVITGFVGVIAGCYLLEVILGHPNWGEAAQSFLPPKLGGPGTLLLASGILGATVMPHVIFLHSALTQNRVTRRDPVRLKKLFRYEFLDILLAMGIAGLVNAAMLLMAAATFHQTEEGQAVASIEDAYKTLQPLLGPAAAYIFAISLLAAGLSSSSVGTMAGQIIMQGFLRWHLPVWLRRFITILPSLIVIYIGCDPTQTLIWSQVILSFGLPFAVFPLILFTRNKALMGTLVNRPTTTFFAWVIGGLVVLLNLFLLWQTFFGE